MCAKRKTAVWLFAALALLLAGTARAGVDIQQWRTTAGTRVFFVESHGLPLLDLSVQFDAGTRRDTAARAGLAALTVHLLSHGAGGLSEDDISRRLADVGALLGDSIDPDRAGLSLRTLSGQRERDSALDVFGKVLQRPDFPEAVVDREKARVVAAIKEEDTQPGPLGDKAFMAAIYGSHPYGLPPGGKVESVSALQRRDVEDFYRSHYAASGAVIAMVGDVTRKEAEAIADRLSAGLPEGGGDGASLPPVPSLTVASLLPIPHPATQSHILMGAPGISRTDPDYFPLYVGNYILGGGGFASRLTEEVREKRGLAYSVYSYFLPLAQPGPFQVGLQTKRDQAGEALELVRATLRRFVAEGPSADELRRAKQNIEGSFPLRIDSNKKILEYLAMIGYYRLPLDYLDSFTKKVDKVTAAQVKDAFKRHVDPDRMVTVTVGAGK